MTRRDLKNRAKKNNEDFNLLLSRYGMERFLYRLSASSYTDCFILKGASLFLVWMGQNYRVTRDADLLCFGSPDLNNLAGIFREICTIDCNEAPPPKLKAYPRYTLVAEKLEAMVQLDLANSRMKDFYDIWLSSKLFPFEGTILHKAIKNTFARRKTALPNGAPFAFTSEFYEDQQKKTQWNAFIKKVKPNVHVESLSIVTAEISRFLQPVIDSIQSASSFEKEWLPEKGWTLKH